jgi:hypothetical protein
MPVKKVNIVCVYKTNKFMNRDKIIEYNSKQVEWLKKMVEKHVSLPFEFICLTDNVEVSKICRIIHLKHNWPGWWSKMELYRPGLFKGPVFYIDLDTVIIRNIDNMLIPGKEGYFVVLKNLCRGYGFGSGLMAWEGDFSELYYRFLKDSKLYMKKFTSSAHWGDQGFLQVNLENTAFWQDHYPRAIISYYFDMYKKGIRIPPKGSKIIPFQGLPKPWDIEASWVPPY